MGMPRQGRWPSVQSPKGTIDYPTTCHMRWQYRDVRIRCSITPPWDYPDIMSEICGRGHVGFECTANALLLFFFAKEVLTERGTFRVIGWLVM